MIVKELKELLEEIPEDKQVGVWNSNGFGCQGDLDLVYSSDNETIWIVDKDDPFDYY